MRILTKATLRKYALAHLDVANEIMAVYDDMRYANWQTAADVKAYDPSARYVGNERWIFNLLRNRYRLIVQIVFSNNDNFSGQIFIRFIGTHAEYDRIPDVSAV